MTTIATRLDSIKDYVASTSADSEYTIESLELNHGDDSAGWLIHTNACDEHGFYDSLRDSSLIIPDDWDSLLSCANNGWEWAYMDKCEVDFDMIRNLVTLDRSLSADEVDEIAYTICNEVGIATP